MGRPVLHKKVKLIIGFIYGNEAVFKKAEDLISKKFGRIDLESEAIDFLYTDYYEKELGENLKRKFISLRRLVGLENIYRVKLLTNRIEHKFLSSGKRTINIDPGYITEGKLVLLTTKDHVHRVYLKDGIFVESTLKFQAGTYNPWETTYPDYKTDAYINIFKKVRSLYRDQLTSMERK